MGYPVALRAPMAVRRGRRVRCELRMAMHHRWSAQPLWVTWKPDSGSLSRGAGLLVGRRQSTS
jgi:hypothetical protein